VGRRMKRDLLRDSRPERNKEDILYQRAVKVRKREAKEVGTSEIADARRLPEEGGVGVLFLMLSRKRQGTPVGEIP